MLRLVLLAVILLGLGSGLSHGWIEIRWDRMLRDTHLPLPGQPQSSSSPRSARS